MMTEQSKILRHAEKSKLIITEHDNANGIQNIEKNILSGSVNIGQNTKKSIKLKSEKEQKDANCNANNNTPSNKAQS